MKKEQGGEWSIPLPRGGEAFFIGYPGYVFTPGLKREWHGQEEQDKPWPLSLRPAHCQSNGALYFPLRAMAAELVVACLLLLFQIRRASA